MPKYRWRVDIIESERGWGTKIIDIKFFDKETEAKDFQKETNKDNPGHFVPDYYIQAEDPRKIMVDNEN